MSFVRGAHGTICTGRRMASDQLSAEYDAGDDPENPVEHNDPATKRRKPAGPTDRQSAVRPKPKCERVFNRYY
jgi:hypothetical protein